MEIHRQMLAETPGEQPRFGSTLRLREESRDVWQWNWLDTAWQDLVCAWRTLSLGFAITAGLILSLGIGLNLTFFQIVNVTLLQPLPVKEPHTLVRFFRLTKNSMSSGVVWQEANFVRRNNQLLSAVLLQASREIAWGEDGSQQLRASFVSGNWFEELGYGAATGRVFLPEVDEKAGAPAVAVLSHEFWQSRLAGDPAIAGKTVYLNNRVVTVIGVASADFPDMRMNITDVWVPFHQMDYIFPGTDHKTTGTDMYGRLRGGVSPVMARESLKASMAEAGRARTEGIAEIAWLEPYLATSRFRSPRDNQDMWTVLFLVTGVTVLVLVIACSNVSNIVLSRAVGRAREFSIRTALGASRWRIMRQLLTESLLLACLGTAGGMVLAAWGSAGLARLIELPTYVDLKPNAALFLAATAVALVSMLATGIAPAWRIGREDLAAAMKDGGQQTSGGLERTRLRKLLVSLQVAGCCLLLFLAGLMIRGLQRVLRADTAFDFYNVATLDPSLGRYGMNSEKARAWWEAVRIAIVSNPETEAAAIVSHPPLGSSLSQTEYVDALGIKAVNMRVEPGFFALMRIPILAGRHFEPSDDHRSSVIISRRLAREMYGTLDVVGKGFPRSARKVEAKMIVGVAGDAHMIKVTATDVAEMYSPLDPSGFADYQLIARARTDAERLLGPMRQAARAADSRVLAQATMMRTQFEKKLRIPRFASLIATLTGLLSLLLACLGIYGVVSFAAALRSKEIGIRMALGAPRAAVLRLLVYQQAWPLAGGIAAGMAIAVPAGRLLQGEPFYLDAADPVVQIAVLFIFALTGGAAALIPGLRAVRLDPIRTLRHD
jgi:predicted permease